MSDQCVHCTERGDIQRCRSTECFQHENWYAVELEKEISKLKGRVMHEEGLVENCRILMKKQEKEISFLCAKVKVLRRYRPEFMNKPLMWVGPFCFRGYCEYE